MGAQAFLVTYLQVSALLFAVEHFPENTPKRWEAIALYLEYHHEQNSDQIFDTFTISHSEACNTGSKRKCSKEIFNGTALQCKELAHILQFYPTLYLSLKEQYMPLLSTPDRKSPLKPLILTPPITTCCDSNILIRNRPSFPIVYTRNGTFVAASYHGHCQKCKRLFYPSHYEDPDSNTYVLYDLSSIKHLQISSQTAFEIEYLDNVSNQLSVCANTFEAIAELYTVNFISTDQERLSHLQQYSKCKSNDTPWRMNAQRLEEGWLLLRLGIFYQSRGMYAKNLITEHINGRKNFEECCKEAYILISSETPVWIYHTCTVPGCTERYCTIDGNEKLTRTMCAAPKSKVKIPSCGISVMSICPNSPALGGYHVHGSKFCKDHLYLENDPDIDIQLDLTSDPDNQKLSHLTPEEVHNDSDLGALDDGTGCRKQCNVTKYYDRTAGIVAIVRPCGVVINIAEMYTNESMTQIYLFLLNTFARGKDINNLRYLGYDRACGLYPFLVNLSKKNIYLAKYLLKHVEFLVDRFHVKGHTETCCMPLENNPECKFHPDLPKFSELSDVNTECAEQTFRWLNRLKYGVRQMSRYKFNFFLHEVVHIHNTIREQHLKAKGRM